MLGCSSLTQIVMNWPQLHSFLRVQTGMGIGKTFKLWA